MTEKLQKVLANLGLGSRRELERWIEAGRITVDGETAKLGCRVTDQQKIYLDGKPINLRKNIGKALLIYHKPRFEVCTQSDPEGRPTVFERLPKCPAGRWIMIGRLDVQTSGLLLFTNDGELANRYMHPKFGLEREYKVRIYGQLSPEKIKCLREGIDLDDGIAKFSRIKQLPSKAANQWVEVVLAEGRNRIVRRLFESLDIKVNKLIRIRFGKIKLPVDLAEGQARIVSTDIL